MFPVEQRLLGRYLPEESNHRSGDGSHDQKQHHHGNWTVLILVVEGRSDESITRDGLNETSGFFKLGSRASWDTFTFAQVTAHDLSECNAGDSTCEQPSSPQASFTTDNKKRHGPLRFRA